MVKASSSSLPLGSVEWGRSILSRSGRLPFPAIALLLEHNPWKPLPDDLRKASIEALRGRGQPGRKPIVGTARLDFKICDAMDLYSQKRAEFRAADREARRAARLKELVLPRGRKSPSEQALEFVKEQMKADFGTIGTRRLRNLLTACKYIRDWEPPDD